MASDRQREANRRNGLKGGPKTEDGKKRTRSNSLKHGLTSSTLVVLPDEDQHEYEELVRSFRDSMAPEGGVEDALVVRLAQAHWRSLRSRCVETAMLNITANLQRRQARRLVEDCPENLNPHEAIGVGFMVTPAEEWQMYLRYDATISRDFFKTLDSLTKLQRLRQRKPRAENISTPEPPPLVYAAGAGAQLFDSGIRSVSQEGVNSAGLPPASGSNAVVISDSAPQTEVNEPKHKERNQSEDRRGRQTPQIARAVSQIPVRLAPASDNAPQQDAPDLEYGEVSRAA